MKMAQLCLEEDKLLVQKVQGAPVLYVKRAKYFIKRELWYKMS